MNKPNDAKAPCLLETRLYYTYSDPWETPIHQFARSSVKGESTGFLTTRPEYLIAGEGKTLSDLMTELNSREGVQNANTDKPESSRTGEPQHTYNAQIYSHFQNGSLDLDFGRQDAEHQSHRIEKQRFLARAVELEVQLYLDALHFWTLHCMHPSGSKALWDGLVIADEVLAWWIEEQQYWGRIATNNAPETARVSGGGNSATDMFVAFANKSIVVAETATASFAADSPLSAIVEAQRRPRHDRYWAEGVCETFRETTLFQLGIPRLMQAVVTNIPREFWVYASQGDPSRSAGPSMAATQLLNWTATLLVFYFQDTLRKHIVDQTVDSSTSAEEAIRTILFQQGGSTLRPTVLREQRWLDDLLARIENIVRLMAQHAVLLHSVIEESFKLNPEDCEHKIRQVDGVRPQEPTKVLCFTPPGQHRKRRSRVGCQDQDCRKASCKVLPCSDRGCRADEVINREFMRQLREQQATLNGTPRESLDANLDVLTKSSAGDLRSHSGDVIVARTAEWDGNKNNDAKARVAAWVALEMDPRAVPLYGNIDKRIDDKLKARGGKVTAALKKRARLEILNARYDEICQQLVQDGHNRTEDERRVHAAQQLQAEVFKGLHGLHALDSVALGNLFQVLGMGDGEANSAIGVQWGDWGGTTTSGKVRKPSKKLVTLKDGLKALSPPVAFPNFELVVCPRPCPVTKSKKDAATL